MIKDKEKADYLSPSLREELGISLRCSELLLGKYKALGLVSSNGKRKEKGK